MSVVVDGLSMRFGGVQALTDVSFAVEQNEVVGIIGPNGSGKTTLMNCLSGFYKPSAGSIRIDGAELAGRNPVSFRAAGIVRTFQNLRVFDELTVLENTLLGMHHYLSGGRSIHWKWIAEALHTRGFKRRAHLAEEAAWASLQRVGLLGRALQKTGGLSYGEKKRLEVARATVDDFSMLLLDEPTAGLSPSEADELLGAATAVVRQREEATLVLVEHRLDVVVRLSTRMMLFDSGRLIIEGEPSFLADHPEVIRVYTGETH